MPPERPSIQGVPPERPSNVFLEVQPTFSPLMVNCVISAVVVGIVAGTAQSEPSLVQQVSQLSAPLHMVFRVVEDESDDEHAASEPVKVTEVELAHVLLVEPVKEV